MFGCPELILNTYHLIFWHIDFQYALHMITFAYKLKVVHRTPRPTFGCPQLKSCVADNQTSLLLNTVTTIKPVYNNHLDNGFLSFWRTSRWLTDTLKCSRMKASLSEKYSFVLPKIPYWVYSITIIMIQYLRFVVLLLLSYCQPHHLLIAPDEKQKSKQRIR